MSRDASELRIGGLEPFSTVDLPGRVAAVVFCQGCSLRCGYCHNPGLISVEEEVGSPAWQDVLDLLERRRGLLDAVVFSGGEPLIQHALEAAVAAVKAQGYAVGLHTAGTVPERLERLLPRLDWVGFDVKAQFGRYGPLTGSAAAGEKARYALELLIAAGVGCEIRATIWPVWHDDGQIEALVETLLACGVKHCVLQEARDPSRRPWPGPRPLTDADLICRLRHRMPALDLRLAS